MRPSLARYPRTQTTGVFSQARRPWPALLALAGFLGSQWLLPNLATLQSVAAAEHCRAAPPPPMPASVPARAAREERPPAWYTQARQRASQREAAMRLEGRRLAATGTGAATGKPAPVTRPVGVSHSSGGRGSRPGLIKPSATLYVPNRYTSPKALDLKHVPTQRELSGAGQMCGALAPTAPADVEPFKARLDQQLKAAGLASGLRANAPANSAAGQLLSKARVRVKRAETMNVTFGQAVQAWNKRDFKQAVPALRQYVRAFPESPWKGEAMIHLADYAKFAGRPNEALALYQQIMRGSSNHPTDMSYEVHQKAKERWADLFLMEGRYGEALPILADIAEHDPHWRRRQSTG